MPFRRSFFGFITGIVMLAVLAPSAHAARKPGVHGAPPVPTADLFVLKSGPSSAAAGTDVSYDLTIQNGGPDPADTATLTDQIPPGMTFVSYTQNNGPAFLCSAPMPGAGGTITCSMATLANGASANFTFVFNIPLMTAPGTDFTNVASASTTTFDPTDENNSAATSTTVSGLMEADLGVTKSGPNVAAPDTDVAYTITVTNAGPDPAQMVTLDDTLPGTMTFVSLTQNSGPAFSCTTPMAGTGGTVSCSGATLNSGAVATFTLVGHIPSGTASGTFYSNTSTVMTTTNDPNSDNNSDVTGLTVTTIDVSINKTGPAMATAGGPIAWTLTASNVGSGNALNVTISDTLPSGTTFVSLIQNSGPAAMCSTPGAGQGGTITCSIAMLNTAASADFTLNASIDPSVAAGSTLSNTATVTVGNDDVNGANDSSTANTTIAGSADLAVVKSGPATVNAGSNLTYTVTLTNSGPSAAANVSLTDAVPANTTFVSETQTAGPTFSCTAPAMGATGTITCTAATFAVGATATFQIVVQASPAVANGTTIGNTANVTSTTPDPSMGNNSSTANTATTSSADLSAVKTGPAAASGGTNVSYGITVTNSGPSNASTVALTDTLPANTVFISMNVNSGPVFTCMNPPMGSPGMVNCTIATMPAGATTSFTLTVHVDPMTPTGPLANTASVSSTTTDPVPGNNSSTATINISSAIADLAITKTAAPPPYGTGLPLTYTIAVANAGPNPATSVVVNDILPAGTTFVSATPSQGSCSGTTTVICSLGTIANGANATITLTVTLPAAQGPVSNTATVTSANPDPDPANNTSTSNIAVIPAAAIPTLSTTVLLLMAVAFAAMGVFMRR
jgi:uncharacterized repeat protein (TIGR01451 family)